VLTGTARVRKLKTVALMAEKRNAYIVSTRNPEGMNT
jgi:hypothetical protein